MKLEHTTIPASLPIAMRVYRFGLVAGGVVWICIASTLCGCSGANGWVKNQSGRHSYNRGNYAAARSEFERALLDNPYNPTYAYNVGKAMEKEGDITGAEQMYNHALTLDPSHQPAYHGLSEMLVAQGRPDEATQLLTAWSQTQPYSAASHVEMAQLHRKSGNFAAAEQEINTALQIRPKYRQALNERSRIYQQTGRQARGGPFSELALTSSPPVMAAQPQYGTVASTPQTSAALNMAATMPQRDPRLQAGPAIQASYSNPQMSAYPGSMPQMFSNHEDMNSQMNQGAMMSIAPSQMHQTHMIPGNVPADAMWSQQQDSQFPESHDHVTHQNMLHMSPNMPMHSPSMQPVPMQSPTQPQMQSPTSVHSQPQMMPQQGMPIPMPAHGNGAVQWPAMQPHATPSMQSHLVPTQHDPAGVPGSTGGPANQHSHPHGNQPVELGVPVPVTQAYPVYSPAPESFSMNEKPGSSPTMISSGPVVQAF